MFPQMAILFVVSKNECSFYRILKYFLFEKMKVEEIKVHCRTYEIRR